jgi:hypothetical protein
MGQDRLSDRPEDKRADSDDLRWYAAKGNFHPATPALIFAGSLRIQTFSFSSGINRKPHTYKPHQSRGK